MSIYCSNLKFAVINLPLWEGWKKNPAVFVFSDNRFIYEQHNIHSAN
jgi:hypothetical protein